MIWTEVTRLNQHEARLNRATATTFVHIVALHRRVAFAIW